MKTKKNQLSTDHWFLTNQTHSNSEIREYDFAKKSQETKIKTSVTRRSFEILRLFMHETKTRKTSINGPRNSYEAPRLICAVEDAKTQIQKFEKMGSQAESVTQCEN